MYILFLLQNSSLETSLIIRFHAFERMEWKIVGVFIFGLRFGYGPLSMYDGNTQHDTLINAEHFKCLFFFHFCLFRVYALARERGICCVGYSKDNIVDRFKSGLRSKEKFNIRYCPQVINSKLNFKTEAKFRHID